MSSALANSTKKGSGIAILLVLISCALGLVMSYMDQSQALVVIGGIVGVALGLASILFPVFGFYCIAFLSFFIVDVNRLLGTNILIGVVLDYFTFAIFVGLLFQKIARKENPLAHLNHPVVYINIIFTLYTLMEFVNPNMGSLQAALAVNRKWLSSLVYMYCSVQFFRTYKDIKRYYIFFLGLCLVSALYACVQEVIGLPGYQLRDILSDESKTAIYRLETGGWRKFSFLDNPKDFGILMSIATTMTLVFLLDNRKGIGRAIMYLLATTIFALAMSFSGTRTATFVLMICIVFYLLLTLNKPRTMIFAAFSFVLFVFVFFAPIYSNNTINRLRSTIKVSDDNSLHVRDINRKSIQPYIYSHPIGGGLGSSGVTGMQYSPGHPLAGFPPDSGLLYFAIESGWIGLLVAAVMYFITLNQGIAAYFKTKSNDGKKLAMVSLLISFGYISAQYSQVAIGFPPGMYLLWPSFAAIVRISQIDKEMEREGIPESAASL